MFNNKFQSTLDTALAAIESECKSLVESIESDYQWFVSQLAENIEFNDTSRLASEMQRLRKTQSDLKADVLAMKRFMLLTAKCENYAATLSDLETAQRVASDRATSAGSGPRRLDQKLGCIRCGWLSGP